MTRAWSPPLRAAMSRSASLITTTGRGYIPISAQPRSTASFIISRMAISAGSINISGAAVLKSSHNQAEAQKFLAFLVSPKAQTLLGQSEVDFEYPLRPGIPPNKLLKPVQRPAAALPSPPPRWAMTRKPERCCSRPASSNMPSGRPSAALIACCCLASLLVLLPLCVTAASAAGAGFSLAVTLLWRPLVGELLENTLLLIACTAMTCALIGTASAWAVERTDLPGRRLFAVLAVVPLAIPPFITSYAWVSLNPSLADFSGALLVVTLSYYPLVYLPVAAALREMDPALGGNRPRARQFRLVGLPARHPAAAAACLAWRHAAGGAGHAGGIRRLCPAALPHVHHRDLFRLSRRILRRRAGLALDDARASLHRSALPLNISSAASARYGRLARGTRRAGIRHFIGAWRWKAAAIAFGAWALLTIGVPLGMIVYWLLQPGDAATAPVAAFAARCGAGGLGVRAALGAGGAALTLALALPLGILAARYEGWLVTCWSAPPIWRRASRASSWRWRWSRSPSTAFVRSIKAPFCC
jgi:ABC-type sulfate transport system permease component